jgi:hypothetical protein
MSSLACGPAWRGGRQGRSERSFFNIKPEAELHENNKGPADIVRRPFSSLLTHSLENDKGRSDVVPTENPQIIPSGNII